MKKNFVLIALLLASHSLSSQISFTNLSKGDTIEQGFLVDLSVDAKTAEKLWEEYIKAFGKFDKDRKNKGIATANVYVTEVSPFSINIISNFTALTPFSQGSFSFYFGDDLIPFDDHVDSKSAAQDFLQEFKNVVDRHVIDEEINEQKKELKSLNRNYDKLVKKSADLNKDIAKAESLILKKKGEIITNDEALKALKVKIAEQNSRIVKSTQRLSDIGKIYD